MNYVFILGYTPKLPGNRIELPALKLTLQKPSKISLNIIYQ